MLRSHLSERANRDDIRIAHQVSSVLVEPKEGDRLLLIIPTSAVIKRMELDVELCPSLPSNEDMSQDEWNPAPLKPDPSRPSAVLHGGTLGLSGARL